MYVSPARLIVRMAVTVAVFPCEVLEKGENFVAMPVDQLPQLTLPLVAGQWLRLKFFCAHPFLFLVLVRALREEIQGGRCCALERVFPSEVGFR